MAGNLRDPHHPSRRVVRFLQVMRETTRSRWRPADPVDREPDEAHFFGGVGRIG